MILLPCPFTGHKMLWTFPSLFVLDQKFIYILWQSLTFFARQKDDLNWFIFPALNAFKFLDWLKMFGPAHNILEPVKGQGISYQKTKKLQV